MDLLSRQWPEHDPHQHRHGRGNHLSVWIWTVLKTCGPNSRGELKHLSHQPEDINMFKMFCMDLGVDQDPCTTLIKPQCYPLYWNKTPLNLCSLYHLKQVLLIYECQYFCNWLHALTRGSYSHSWLPFRWWHLSIITGPFSLDTSRHRSSVLISLLAV